MMIPIVMSISSLFWYEYVYIYVFNNVFAFLLPFPFSSNVLAILDRYIINSYFYIAVFRFQNVKAKG